MTSSTEFVALVKANATKVSLEVRDVSYAVEAAGQGRSGNKLADAGGDSVVDTGLVAYSLKG
jgi:hypothetical protein